MIHGAEFRSAHGTERCILKTFLRQRPAQRIRLRRFRIERKSELVSVVRKACSAKSTVVAISSPRTMTSDIGRVRSNLIGDQPLACVLPDEKPQVLLWASRNKAWTRQYQPIIAGADGGRE